jgi:2-methylcitrate dehydratase PrpD
VDGIADSSWSQHFREPHVSNPQDLGVFSEYLSSVSVDTLPKPITQTIKACLLYGLAVGIATRSARPALLAQSASQSMAEEGTTTRLIDGARSAHGSAVFANAVLLSGRVQGDSHPCGHIGGVVIPAALASAERANASGRELLSALVSGYESALRIGRDHAADLSLHGFRTTPCYGVFGAAVAAGRIGGFSGARIKNAIAFAANFASGLRQYVDAGTEESPFHAGFAARNGVYAAELVASGLEAADSALHGPAGFYRAYGMPGTDYGTRLTEELGQYFEFTSVTFKQYPACQFHRGIIRGLSVLRSRAGEARVASIEIRMNPYEADFIGVRFAGPFTSPTQTIMSAPFCASLAWATGTASFDGFRTYDDPRVNALLSRVSVITDPLRKRYEPEIKVLLDNGSVLEWVEQGGDADYRINWESAVEMTLQLGHEVKVPDIIMRRVIERVATIETEDNVRSLIAAVCTATTSGRQ